MLISVVKWLIVINRIQNKSFSLHNICVSSMYINYVYIYIYMYIIHTQTVCILKIYIHIIYIINTYIQYIKKNYSEIYTCMCVYFYIINIHSTHTYIM